MANVTYHCDWEKKDNSGPWYWIYYAKNGEEERGAAKATCGATTATIRSG
ncbi:MAG: hypothetical protein SXG53_02420 [Pseudomonadota bacterium]|nr:hypothetical protein [Pseudomonadota bacterium]